MSQNDELSQGNDYNSGSEQEESSMPELVSENNSGAESLDKDDSAVTPQDKDYIGHLNAASIAIRTLSILGSFFVCIHVWSHCSAAASILLGVTIFPIIGMFFISTAINLKVLGVIPENDNNKKKGTQSLEFFYTQPTSYRVATFSMLLFCVLGWNLGFLSSNSLDIVAGIGAVGGVVDWLLFSSYGLYEKSKNIGYFIIHILGVASISSAALLSVHLITFSIINGMVLEISVEELNIVCPLIAVAAFFIIPTCTLVLEKILDSIEILNPKNENVV